MTIHPHILFDILAYTIGFRFFLYLKNKQDIHLNTEQQVWILIGALLGAGLGSKLVGFLEHPLIWSELSNNIMVLVSSKTIVGGLLGGVLGVEIAKKCLGIKRSTGDVFCYPLILGMMIGRIGCFLSGIEDGTHGNPTDSFLGMDMGDGIKRHPVSLYEILYLGLVWISIYWIANNYRLNEGSKFKLFMIFYLTWRLLIDFMKPITPLNIGLSAIQIACVLGLLYYSQFIFKRKLLFVKD